MRLLICLLLFTCAPVDIVSQIPIASAEEVEPPPCHDPLHVRKEATRIVLVTCSGSETEIKFSEITGPAGNAGGPGERGPSGSPAPEEKKIPYCRHDPVTHTNHTLSLKPSEIVTKFSGYYGTLDFPGDCGQWENLCSCDNKICQNPNPAVRHNFLEIIE